jgi:hypothetical protein
MVVIDLAKHREVKKAAYEDQAYEGVIKRMDKLELLEEMVRFQEERCNLDKLTLPLIIKGRILFGALEASAETSELRLLTRSYKRHLDYELASYLGEPPQPAS